MACPGHIIRFLMCIVSPSMPPPIAFIFASKLVIRNSVFPTRRISFKNFTRHMSTRWKMTSFASRRAQALFCSLATGLLFAGCSLKQDMALQPKNRPLSPSDFFDDGRSERALVENTVARGWLAEDQFAVPK